MLIRVNFLSFKFEFECDDIGGVGERDVAGEIKVKLVSDCLIKSLLMVGSVLRFLFFLVELNRFFLIRNFLDVIINNIPVVISKIKHKISLIKSIKPVKNFPKIVLYMKLILPQ